MHTFKDFLTGKIRRTRGTFIGWTPPTGLLRARYAIFRNPRGDVLVPAYLLTEETRQAIIGEREANANLIIAAPELYEALRAARNL